jgi:hypothetical protein
MIVKINTYVVSGKFRAVMLKCVIVSTVLQGFNKFGLLYIPLTPLAAIEN